MSELTKTKFIQAVQRFSKAREGDFDFYACLDKDMRWFDSALSLEMAIHWCCLYSGAPSDMAIESEIEWLNRDARHLGMSIIHGTLLKELIELGLID